MRSFLWEPSAVASYRTEEALSRRRSWVELAGELTHVRIRPRAVGS